MITASGAHWQVLYRQDGYCVGQHRCIQPNPSVIEETTARHEFIFVRSGAFVHHGRHGRITADVNHVLFFEARQPYRISHPAGGDDCIVLQLPDSELLAALTSLWPAVEEHPDRPFPVAGVSCPLDLTTRLFAVLRSLEEASPDALRVQERLLMMMPPLLDAVSRVRSSSGKAERGATRRRHIEITENLKLLLFQHLGERLDLATLGRKLEVSSFHLARLFREHTGNSIHGYRLRLRLREALARVAAGERDLTRLALDLGFADHAHFTRAFRREIGVPPSEARRRYFAAAK